ncbi:OmpA family protein [Paenimyroides viscosum]|uniref:OmpA family protein n=1 Tax=Paenimyroides viscosum TaxID=2488729 RepID=A0A3P1B6Z2_9FLAO|nr:OmpA family protein [Paenimyroides viscosum]RRA96661.1 OmpA family protein [Paenimyroides viscosum]
MENPLVNQIKQYITPDFISSLAVSTNETEASINNAFDVAIPALLLKMHHKGDAYLRPMFSEIQNVFANSVNEFEFKLEKTASYLDDFLGTDKQEFVERISAFSNISQTSAHSVLKTAFLGIIDYFKGLDANFDLSTINGVMSNNLTSLKSMIPVGFGSLGAVDSTINQPTAVHTEERAHADAVINNVVNNNEKDQFKTNESPYADPNKGGNMLKYMLIPLLLGIVLIFFLYRGCNRDVTIEESVVTDTIQSDTSTTVTTTRTTKEIVVNDQIKLNAYSEGIEDQMVAFLNKGEYKNMTEDQLKEVWFNFDDLNFEHGTANVLPESQKQLDNIAQILKAYPEVKIKIGGYTDKTGNEAVNKKVSTERAMAVKKFLDDKGLSKQVVGTEGYGSEFAVHSADASEELRLTDRKVALSIRN